MSTDVAKVQTGCFPSWTKAFRSSRPASRTSPAPAGMRPRCPASLIASASVVPDLASPPAWINWDHAFAELWPPPDDRGIDLNNLPESGWLDRFGISARGRLATTRATAPVRALRLGIAQPGRFSEHELQETWAAGLWIRSFNAKEFLLDGFDTLTRAEAEERLRRAAAR